MTYSPTLWTHFASPAPCSYFQTNSLPANSVNNLQAWLWVCQLIQLCYRGTPSVSHLVGQSVSRFISHTANGYSVTEWITQLTHPASGWVSHYCLYCFILVSPHSKYMSDEIAFSLIFDHNNKLYLLMIWALYFLCKAGCSVSNMMPVFSAPLIVTIFYFVLLLGRQRKTTHSVGHSMQE